jgi:hypothetical protein
VALRATVRALRAELDSVWEAAAAATEAARADDASRWALELPLVAAALAPAEVAEIAAAAAAAPALAGVGSIELDLRPDIATTEILLSELREIVLADLPVVRPAEEAAVVPADEPSTVPADEPSTVPADEPVIVLSDLPESAMLDPKLDRDGDVIDVTAPATASAAETVLPERRTA